MKYYFSRKPGQYVNALTGEYLDDSSFTGTVREWYEKMMKFFIKKSQDHFKSKELFQAVVSPDVFTIHECTIVYYPMIDIDGNYTYGKVNNQYEVRMDRNQQRNLIVMTNPANNEKLEFEIVDLDII